MSPTVEHPTGDGRRPAEAEPQITTAPTAAGPTAAVSGATAPTAAAPTATVSGATAPTAAAPAGGDAPAARPSRRFGLRAAWMMTASGWSANQFSALLGAYRSEMGLSEATVTGLFAVYVVGLVPGLLIGGPLADRHGRRPVALTALGVNLLSTMLLMAGTTATWWLLPGRFLTGVGAGALLAAGSAWVKELSSPPYAALAPAAAAKRAGLFVSAGFASGGLVASLIAQWAPHPMLTAYLPHLVLASAAGAAAFGAPESGRPRPTSGAPTAPRGAAPYPRARYRRAILPLAPWVFAGPTVGFATLPGLVDDGLTGWQTVYAGIATAVVPGAGLLVQPLARRVAARHRLATAVSGLLVIAAGFALAVPAAAAEQPALALAAAAVLGAGYGLALTYGLTEVAALAPPERLARLTALFWTLAYLGMFTPYALALLSAAFPVTALLAAGAALAVLTCGVLILLNRGAEH
ncbi:MFS transporter [Streptomyces sp. LX-29]|uniref:MFS transporter n=1 Tax=Streptomyces sp. LX-29 TaxID=2900152 RepID=UPI00240D9795|nr:MFS transporter [Streptomyces sp. LX-29]WFB06142.1 MFS transporter [Streptomyces sp. LX-29]